MPEIAIMIEGQNGLNWSRWQRLALAVEGLGFAGIYRSDHFTNAVPPDQDSLELWVSLAWLASHTSRIEFGPLVSPMSFRHPSITARMAAAIDDLSGGRLTLGLGAGWQEREHNIYGLDLLEIPARFVRLEEGVQVIRSLLRSDQPVKFSGKFYNLKDSILLPRPNRPGGPPILIGGNGQKYTLPLVARYADEWNGVYLPAAKFRTLNQKLDDLLVAAGRHPQDVQRSLMTGCIFAHTHQELALKVKERTDGKRTVEELIQRGMIVGTSAELVEQLNRLGIAGAQRIMLQWLELDNLDGLSEIAGEVLPKVQENAL